MQKCRIAKMVTFEAAHQLPNHAGKCSRLHGHSYRVELQLEGLVRPADGASNEGMVVDFSDVKAVWDRVHTRIDHSFLNDVLDVPTTAENIATWLLAELKPALPQLTAVRVWETATSWAEACA